MKKLLLLSLLCFFTLFSFSQEYIFKFRVNSKKEIEKLTNLISIDNYKNGEITAYANEKEFEFFKTLGYKFELLKDYGKGKAFTMATTVSEMSNWDRYPTYDVYIQMMNDFASDYPTLCQVVTIGSSEENKDILAVKISDNVSTHEAEPEFFYSGTMHGDELAGYVLLLRLIDHLLTNYGTDTRITNLVNNVEIYINPAANPDGTYATSDDIVGSSPTSTRSNSHGVDLNRNFPTPNLTNPSNVNESEIQAMIAFAENHNFVFSANTHGGAEVINYPWDSWYSSTKTHPDHNWLEHISHNYADSVHVYGPIGYLDGFDNGVTHGADWYLVNGSRQDHMTYFQNCREITLELSDVKALGSENLPAYWNYNRSAFIGFIEECLYGFNGTVKNTEGESLNAKIEITAHDLDNSEVYTDPVNGDYYRPIEPGTYSVTYSAFGHISQTIDVTITDWETTKIQNVILSIDPSTHTLSGNVTEEGTGTPLENVEIEILNTPINSVYSSSDGSYSRNAIEDGTYQVRASKYGYLDDTLGVVFSGNDEILNFMLIQNVTITGTVTEDGTSTPIQDVTIEVLNSSIPSVQTNALGEYLINNVPQTNQQIKACKLNNTTVILNEAVSSSNTIFNFTLESFDAINFETEIPSFFEFSGNANWDRDQASISDCEFGEFSLKSEDISNNQSAGLTAELNIISSGNLSFFKKVSSESGYDYLRFYIDDILQNSWSGQSSWSKAEYPIDPGIHTFKWIYSKDGSESNGEDAAWIDIIIFPPYDSTDIERIENNILIYPNPSDGDFTVKSSNLIKSILISDITGKTYEKFQISDYVTNLSIQNAGIYIITITTDDNIFHKKIIIR